VIELAVDENEFDVVVVGSGAAGLTAALTAAHHGLRAVVVEKADTYGGSTARSGGALWVPGNEVLREAGVADTAELAQSYLEHVAGKDVPVARQRALLAHGPAMVSLVLEKTPLHFAWVPNYSDYYPEAPGGLAQGRTIEPVPLDGRVLGAELRNLAPPYAAVPDGVTVTGADYKWLSLGTRHPRALVAGARVGGRWLASMVLRRRLLSMGQALVAGLRAGLLAADVPVLLGTGMDELLVDGGRVVGVRAGGRVLRARRGVVLAAGGFEHNAAMRERYQPSPASWTVGAPGNTGDAITAGHGLGAALDLMDDAWWGPSIPLPAGPFFCLAERSLPGCIIVNAAGQRFVNESAPYVDAVHAMYDTGAVPAWLIVDQRYRGRYLLAGRAPRQPLPGRWFREGVAHRAATLDELASRIGVPAPQLQATIARFNGFAATGVDADFQRGASVYDRYYGDPRTKPNPNLGRLDRAPFYAFQIVPGDLGTKGGLRTDERARVLREDGTHIPRLYAAGNTSAAVMGHSYAGAGATIGPAMTFGYIAALDLAAPPLPHQAAPAQTPAADRRS
jgi:3-oxosteroid 1-dehydrogenase